MSHTIWIDPAFGVDKVLALVLERMEDDGQAVLRGNGARARRVLAKVAAQLPEDLEAYRIPEPSNPEVTTLIVHRAGERGAISFWPGDDEV